MAVGSNTPPEPLQRPNENHTAWLLRRVWERVNRSNEHFMGCIVGREGSGKSYTALKMAHAVDPTFTADRVIFDVVELLKVLKNGEHEAGQFYVLDEAGVQLGNRTWQERGQILANQALQLVRNENLGLIFTLPRLSELDSQTEGRLQVLLEMVGKEDGEYVDCKWKFMEPDRIDSSGNILKKFPRRIQDGKKKRITRIRFTPPAAEIVEPYEAEKSEFQDEFYQKTIEQLEEAEGDDETDEEMSVKEIATELADGGLEGVVSEHGNTGEPYINHQLIRAQYDISHDDAKAVKSLLEQQFDLTDDVV